MVVESHFKQLKRNCCSDIREQVGKLNFPRGQALHFLPRNPRLHLQCPVSLSHVQSVDPYLLHLHAVKRERKNKQTNRKTVPCEIFRSTCLIMPRGHKLYQSFFQHVIDVLRSIPRYKYSVRAVKNMCIILKQIF